MAEDEGFEPSSIGNSAFLGKWVIKGDLEFL
jgi:hypothetical protein